jgi:hypothetical protein
VTLAVMGLADDLNTRVIPTATKAVREFAEVAMLAADAIKNVDRLTMTAVADVVEHNDNLPAALRRVNAAAAELLALRRALAERDATATPASSV